MTEDELQEIEVRNESWQYAPCRPDHDIRALLVEVRVAQRERLLVDSAVAGFCGCVPDVLAKQLKDAIAFARREAAKP
jgi:hypothetical protein